MILGKIWKALKAQLNKVANYFYGSDPVAQMQYEYDLAVDQLKEGRVGLEQYRALVERVLRQVNSNRNQVSSLETKVKAYLQRGDRDTAAKFAVELQRAQKELAENESQLKMHEEAYNNNLLKIQHASGKLAQLRERIRKYDADLKMSRAEAELARISNTFNLNVTTDFGEVEQQIQDQISHNRAKARVAADLSREGIETIEAEKAVETAEAEEILKKFEQDMGLITPATQGPKTLETRELGPAQKATQLNKQG